LLTDKQSDRQNAGHNKNIDGDNKFLHLSYVYGLGVVHFATTVTCRKIQYKTRTTTTTTTAAAAAVSSTWFVWRY